MRRHFLHGYFFFFYRMTCLWQFKQPLKWCYSECTESPEISLYIPAILYCYFAQFRWLFRLALNRTHLAFLELKMGTQVNAVHCYTEQISINIIQSFMIIVIYIGKISFTNIGPEQKGTYTFEVGSICGQLNCVENCKNAQIIVKLRNNFLISY